MDDLRQTGIGDASFAASFSRVRRLSRSLGPEQEGFWFLQFRRRGEVTCLCAVAEVCADGADDDASEYDGYGVSGDCIGV